MTKQLKIVLGDELRAKLDAAAAASGRSVAEEIRQRVERSFEQDAIDPPTGKLMEAVDKLAVWVRVQTGHNWHRHPAASRVLQTAIGARIARLRAAQAGGGEEAVFEPEELPVVRVVAAGSDDPREMGLALEALEFHTPTIGSKLSELRERMLKVTRERQKKESDDK